jgi:hypothetical protein
MPVLAFAYAIQSRDAVYEGTANAVHAVNAACVYVLQDSAAYSLRAALQAQLDQRSSARVQEVRGAG